MSHLIEEYHTNIYKLPKARENLGQQAQVTIGDLHGNSMKLLFMLIREGIATNILPANYQKLVDIYLTKVDELTHEHIALFNLIVENIEFEKKSVLLIGDESGDRGSNDYFTLKILFEMQKQAVPFKILLSNHGFEFFQACLNILGINKFGIVLIRPDDWKPGDPIFQFKSSVLKDNIVVSLTNLNNLVKRQIIKAEDVLSMAEQAYLPNLNVISYSLAEDYKEITIYSHAPVDLDIIGKLASQFQVKYQDSTSMELAKTIDAINTQFIAKSLTKNFLIYYFPWLAMIEGYTTARTMADLSANPLVFTMWNRRYDLLKRPDQQNNYKLSYVHGHDDKDPLNHSGYVFNLDVDNDLGKSAASNRGLYMVLITKGIHHDLSEQAINPMITNHQPQEPLIHNSPQLNAEHPDPLAPLSIVFNVAALCVPVDTDLTDVSVTELPFNSDNLQHATNEQNTEFSPADSLVADNASSSGIPSEKEPELKKIQPIDEKKLTRLKSLLDIHLNIIKEKAQLLRNAGHIAAADAADLLHQTISDSYPTCLPDDLQLFKDKCYAAINTARPELEKHRPVWRDILRSIVLIFSIIGIPLVINDQIHFARTGRHTTFFQTASAQKLNALEKVVDDLHLQL